MEQLIILNGNLCNVIKMLASKKAIGEFYSLTIYSKNIASLLIIQENKFIY